MKTGDKVSEDEPPVYIPSIFNLPSATDDTCSLRDQVGNLESEIKCVSKKLVGLSAHEQMLKELPGTVNFLLNGQRRLENLLEIRDRLPPLKETTVLQSSSPVESVSSIYARSSMFWDYC